MSKYYSNTFWCINCGQETMPLMRKQGQGRNKFHRKRLYCYHCKIDINCVECRSEIEIQEFKQDYQLGNFKAEAKESMKHCKGEI